MEIQQLAFVASALHMLAIALLLRMPDAEVRDAQRRLVTGSRLLITRMLGTVVMSLFASFFGFVAYVCAVVFCVRQASIFVFALSTVMAAAQQFVQWRHVFRYCHLLMPQFLRMCEWELEMEKLPTSRRDQS